MAATIKIKNSSTAGAAPTSSDLVQGELAVNVTDKRLFTENSGGTVVELGTNPSSITLPDGSASAPTLLHSGDTNTGLFFPAADTIALTTGGTERLRLDSSGNLGLGVTPSAWTSGVKAIQFGLGANVFGSTSSYNNTNIVSNMYYNSGGTAIYQGSDYASFYQQVSGQHKWFNAASGTAGNAISFTQAMTLDASSKLNVFYPTNAAFYAQIDSRDGNSHFGAIGASASVVFRTQDTERARIDSSGNLLVGATSQVNSEKFLVVQTNANYSQTIKNSNASPNGLYIVYSGASPNNTANEFLYFNDSTTTRLMVKSNGGIYNYSANNSNLSDERTKTDIQNAGGYLAKICAIPVRTFKYKDQTDDLLNLGVIAQEVEAVAPELVDASGFGETPEDGVPLKAIYQTDLQYALMKALQELKAEFDAYKATHP